AGWGSAVVSAGAAAGVAVSTRASLRSLANRWSASWPSRVSRMVSLSSSNGGGTNGEIAPTWMTCQPKSVCTGSLAVSPDLSEVSTLPSFSGSWDGRTRWNARACLALPDHASNTSLNGFDIASPAALSASSSLSNSNWQKSYSDRPARAIWRSYSVLSTLSSTCALLRNLSNVAFASPRSRLISTSAAKAGSSAKSPASAACLTNT